MIEQHDHHTLPLYIPKNYISDTEAGLPGAAFGQRRIFDNPQPACMDRKRSRSASSAT